MNKKYQDSFNDFIQIIASSALNIFVHSTSRERKIITDQVLIQMKRIFFLQMTVLKQIRETVKNK